MHYVTAGESHGPKLTSIVYDVPSGLTVSARQINVDLSRRQFGYGRGGRQKIEDDIVEISSGVRFGITTGSPIALTIKNNDWEAWHRVMAIEGVPPKTSERETIPRPGHADLVGVLKRNMDDCRNVFERASARETAARVAAAGVAREFLAEFNVDIFSYVNCIGSVALKEDDPMMHAPDYKPLDIGMSDVHCPDTETTQAMIEEIDNAKQAGDALGGTFRIVACGLIPGLGDYTQGHKRLASQLASAVFSIPAIKGVEFGLGFEGATKVSSQVQDRIKHTKRGGYTRESNNAGGLEGGMTTGMPLIITAAMKPIPTLQKNPLTSVDIDTLEECEASVQRSDTCAVPAAAVVAEGEVAFILASAYMEKFGHDSMDDIKASFASYKKRLKTASK